MVTDENNVVPRKFTLPASLAERMEELANRDYAGNRSQFLRAAIKDHARTLEGEDEFAFKKLRQEVEELGAKVENLEATVEEDLGQRPVLQAQQPATITDEDQVTDYNEDAVKKEIQGCLLDADGQALELDEIEQRVDYDVMAVQDALQSLIEQDFIASQSSGQDTHYQISPPE